ncbi:MAG: phenylalanine--tRNA ligase subunit beta [Thermoanaerobaculum sp.]
MKVLYSWLCQHLVEPAETAEMAERLTACGLNVELRTALEGDEVWDVDVTTNRPDCLAHRGMAREAAAAGAGRLAPLSVRLVESGPPVAELAAVSVEDPQGCPRYCARVIRGVKVGPSPQWLQKRLAACGIRPINNVVDATNYVLLDLGHPLHAFDLERIEGRRIRVRRARPGERLVTLDGVERELLTEDLVIADHVKPVALAGIMGGAFSEITETTRDVLLESAYFAPALVRRTRKRLGLDTEASRRFERGADRAMARQAVDAVAALILELAGGEVASGVLDSCPELPPAAVIPLDLHRLAAFAGCPIPEEFVRTLLAALEIPFEVEGQVFRCRVPSHRVDLELPEDLYEEVLRHWGYDRIPSLLPPLHTGPGERRGSFPVTDRARDLAAALGLAEAVTYAFVPEEVENVFEASPLAARGQLVRLENPLSARAAVMRRTLWSGLVEAAANNLRRGAQRVALFEVGRAFFADGTGVREEERLAVILAGEVGSWDSRRPVDFLDLKGIAEALAEGLGLGDVSYVPLGAPFAPGSGARMGRGDEVIGVLGKLSEAAQALYDAPRPLWALELALAPEGAERAPIFVELSRFPAVVADLTVRHPVSLPYGELVGVLWSFAPEILESVEPVVRYRGDKVGPDEVKTTLRLTYRHRERSLTQEEVNAAHFALMEKLASTLPVAFG